MIWMIYQPSRAKDAKATVVAEGKSGRHMGTGTVSCPHP
jgi:hypothetical protein